MKPNLVTRGVITVLPAVDLDARTTGIPSFTASAPAPSIFGGKVPEPKPVIIIPAYNPPKSFMTLLQNVRNLVSIPILIIDDGSTPKIVLKDNDSYKNKIL